MSRIYVPRPNLMGMRGKGIPPIVMGEARSVGYSVIESGLLAWWKHNEGAGALLNDYSGGGNHGTIVGAGVWANRGPDGIPVCTYDGTNDYTNGMGNVLGWSGTDSRTFMMAFRSDTIGADPAPNVLLSRRAVGAATLNLLIQQTLYIPGEEDEFRFTYYGVGAVVQSWKTTNFNLAINTWYIATFQMTMGAPGDVGVYRNLTGLTGAWAVGDGTQQGAVTAVNIQIADSDDTGLDGGPDRPWAGRIGDVLIYDRILSFPEIENNFNALAPRYGL